MLLQTAFTALFCAVSVSAADLRGSQPEERELYGCYNGVANCGYGTSGPCIQSNGVCHKYGWDGSCPAGTTECGGGGGGSGPSYACKNTAAHDGKDEKCTYDKPFCMMSSGYEPANQVAGDECKKCINTTPSPMHPDMGCPADKPLCLSADNYEAPLGQAGDYCAPNNFPCFNTAAHDGIDDGCDAYAPICVGEYRKQIDASCYGAECVKCFNSYEADWVPDFGCPADKPRCALYNGDNPQVNFGGDHCESLGKYLWNEEGANLNTAYRKESPEAKAARMSGTIEIGNSGTEVKYDPMDDAVCFNEDYYPNYDFNPVDMYHDYVKLIEDGFANPDSFSEENGHVTNQRIGSMMLRMCFHDNSVSLEHGKFEEYIASYISDYGEWTGPPTFLDTSGADASVLVCPSERKHVNQDYDHTASRVLRAFQRSDIVDNGYGGYTSMKEKYDLSYADLLTNGCIAATIFTMGLDPEEVLVGSNSYGSYKKASNPMTFGRHDACYKEGYNKHPLCGPSELLPGLFMTPKEVNDWFAHRGMYECLWMGLMLTHTTFDNMAFECPLKTIACTATQDHVDLFDVDPGNSPKARRYFETGDELDYFDFFLNSGEHKRKNFEDPSDPSFDPEKPNCDWTPEGSAVEKPWPLTLIDCTLGLDNVMAAVDTPEYGFDEGVDKLAYAIKNFHNIGSGSTASDILLCALNNLAGHWQGTCEAPVTEDPPKGSCAPFPGELLFGAYGHLKYIDGSYVY